jgi:hypothetical protein
MQESIMKKSLIIIAASIAISATASLAGNFTCTSKVATVFTEGYNGGWQGDVIVTTKDISANCNGGQFVIENAAAGKNTVLSNALAAAAQGKDVSINWFDTDKKTPFARIYWFQVNY